jgi:4-amino-4-deoxy-L-arabinose transferase-like glycosyltransferase
MLLGLKLRLHNLWTAQYNYDEGATLYFSDLSLATLWGSSARIETNPPLFYTVAHAMRWLGASAEDLRLLSVAAGLACIPLVFLLGERIGGRFVGLAAAALVATSATQITMSRDARTYAVLTATSLVAILAVHSMLCRGSRRAAWTYAAAALVSLYLHNTAVLLVAACNALFLLPVVDRTHHSPERIRRWVLANAVVAAGWLPRALLVAHQTVSTLAHFWIPQPTISSFGEDVSNAYALRILTFGAPVAEVLFPILFSAGLWASRRTSFARSLAIAVPIGVPVASFILSLWRPILNGKTLLWPTPVGLCFVALGCRATRPFRYLTLALPMLLQLALSLQPLVHTGDVPSSAFQGWRAAATLMMQSPKGRAALVVAPRFLSFMLAEGGLPSGTFATFSLGDADPWFEADSVPAMLPGQALDTLRGFDTIWLATRAQEGIAAAFLARMDCAYSHSDPWLGQEGLTVVRLDRRTTSACPQF